MNLLSIVSLVVGFSLVVLVHELGHFLAARAVGIRCEQFALGFGQAIFSFRRGLGFRAGSSEKEFQEKLTAGADPKSLGATEYRWNWVPLGGYVKMLGQDDTKPGLVVDDPQSYTSKSVGQRMLVIAAGVIMNIIFAGVAFTVLFFTGLKVPQAIVGTVQPMSPAQQAVREDGTPAPLEVGDQILSINGREQYNDFRKIALNVALAKEGEPLKVQVRRADGKVEDLKITPTSALTGEIRLLGIGVGMPYRLEGPEPTKDAAKGADAAAEPVEPGETIVKINGQNVSENDISKLDAAVQAANGQPVSVTVKSKDGTERQTQIKTVFVPPFGDQKLNFAGMLPRAMIAGVYKESDAYGKLKEGDVVLGITVAGDEKHDPSVDTFVKRVNLAGANGQPVTITVLRDGKTVVVPDLKADKRLDTKGTKGIGLGTGYDLEHAVVGATIENSATAAVPPGSRIDQVNGKKVEGWNDAFIELRKSPEKTPISLVVVLPSGESATYTITPSATEMGFLHSLCYRPDADLQGMTASRTTRNPALAAWWGVEETRDSILQVYVTLRRLVEGSVPLGGIVGPVGMFQMGTKVADAGWDHLLWFLAIISANLAVVNFLPVPVVDGGHFTFLILEKLRGKPVSERTMVVAQYIGLGLILALFLTVTYQDVLRLLTFR